MTARLTESDSILKRIERLERENRILKILGATVLLSVSIVFFTGQTRPNRTLEAEGFVLKDAKGNVRGRLGMDSPDKPTLTLLDTSGQAVVRLCGFPTSPFLHLAGDTPLVTLAPSGGKRFVSLGTAQQISGLAIKDEETEAYVQIFKGSAQVNLLDQNGKERVGLELLKNLGTGLTLSDSDGTARAKLDVTPDSGSSLTLNDKEGFVTRIGTAELETPRTGETRKTSAASVAMFDKEGKVVWRAP